MPNFRPSITMNADKQAAMQRAAFLFEELELTLDHNNPDPRLAAIAKTQLEIAAAMYNKALAFGATNADA